MPWTAYIAHFFAAAVLTNGIPHFVNGVIGRRFRTPFVRLSGTKLSSPVTNVLWGSANFAVALLLFTSIGWAYIGTIEDMATIAAGVLLTGMMLARIFERESA